MYVPLTKHDVSVALSVLARQLRWYQVELVECKQYYMYTYLSSPSPSTFTSSRESPTQCRLLTPSTIVYVFIVFVYDDRLAVVKSSFFCYNEPKKQHMPFCCEQQQLRKCFTQLDHSMFKIVLFFFSIVMTILMRWSSSFL